MAVDDDLYREIILDHYRNPRHHGAVEAAGITVEASNPLCGDEITLTMRLQDGLVSDVAFDGHGCSISQASASMLCDAVAGLPSDKAVELGREYRAMVLEGAEPTAAMGDLELLAGVRSYPARIKCAMLAANALLNGLGEEVR
jgi:nitrogen fixation NifU-like protein